MSALNIKFNTSNRELFNTLRQRVDEYFKTNQISKFANYKMVIKTIALFALYFTPYFLLIFNTFPNTAMQFFCCLLMGFGMSGIGLSVMHDAVHGAYARNKTINDLLCKSMNLIGGSSLNWSIQHNTLHHTYTNVHEIDEDIAPAGFLRFEPHAKLSKIHKYQFLYAWFFYGLMTIMWATTKDFKQLSRYNRKDLLKLKNTTYKKELINLIFNKLFYFTYTVIIPYMLLDLPFYQIIIGWLIMHYVAGIMLALIFQPAHVIDTTDFPLPKGGSMEDDFATHQLRTTTNFGTNSIFMSWFVGGLNFQVEHHLFPNICHIHYKKIAPIVKKTVEEFNIPYLSKSTFVGAIYDHAKILYDLGRPNKLKA